MQVGAIPFFLAFVVLLGLGARFIDRWEFYRFTDKEEYQFCKPSLQTGSQAFGRDVAYLEPEEVVVHDLVRFRHARLGKVKEMTARVVAVQGQRIAIEHGAIKIDGKPFDDVFGVSRNGGADWMAEVLVPAGCVFVLGDLRDQCDRWDSRTLGPIPLACLLYDFGPHQQSGGGR